MLLISQVQPCSGWSLENTLQIPGHHFHPVWLQEPHGSSSSTGGGQQAFSQLHKVCALRSWISSQTTEVQILALPCASYLSLGLGFLIYKLGQGQFPARTAVMRLISQVCTALSAQPGMQNLLNVISITEQIAGIQEQVSEKQVPVTVSLRFLRPRNGQSRRDRLENCFPLSLLSKDSHLGFLKLGL